MSRRVLRQYSKSQLEAIVDLATRKEVTARAAFNWLRARYLTSLAVWAGVTYALGLLTAAAVLLRG